jgi:hypothetical protein
LVIGSSLKMQLTVQGNTVTGTGTYALEAGRSGALTVSGSVNGSQLSLSFAYDYGATASYAATFADDSHLTGTLSNGGGSSSTLTFVRQ